MTTLPRRAVAAFGAWASLIIYVLLMAGFIDDARGVADTATSPATLDTGQTNVAALVGTAVVGVIAGIAGVSIAKTSIRRAGHHLGEFLGVAGEWRARFGYIPGIAYMVVYFATAVVAGLVWRDHGTDLTPEFLRNQVLAAVGLLTAMAALSSGNS
jgi:hypothetical protein